MIFGLNAGLRCNDIQLFAFFMDVAANQDI